MIIIQEFKREVKKNVLKNWTDPQKMEYKKGLKIKNVFSSIILIKNWKYNIY